MAYAFSGCRVVVLAVAAVGLPLVLSGCERGEGADSAGKPVVVTTIWPLASLAEQVAGEHAEVVYLVAAGQTPHGFEPMGRDAEAVRRARLLVMVGGGFDNWARRTFDRHARGGAGLLVFADLVGEAEAGGSGGGHGHQHHDHHHNNEGHDHDHAGPNAHLWLDPVLARRLAAELGERIGRMVEGAEARAAIERNTAALLEELDALHAEFAEALAPHAGAKLVTYHNAFDLLAERYGLEVAATLIPVDSPGAMTPARVERALAVVREHGVRTIFAEPQFPATAAGMVQREAGVRLLTLDPIGDPDRGDRDSYQKVMRYNLQTLLEGLEGE